MIFLFLFYGINQGLRYNLWKKACKWLHKYASKYGGKRPSNKHLSHNNPCFQCNIVITSFFVSHT